MTIPVDYKKLFIKLSNKETFIYQHFECVFF